MRMTVTIVLNLAEGSTAFERATKLETDEELARIMRESLESEVPWEDGVTVVSVGVTRG